MNANTHLRNIVATRFRSALQTTRTGRLSNFGPLFQGQVPGDDRETPDHRLSFVVDSTALRRECAKAREKQYQHLARRRSRLVALTAPLLITGWLLLFTGASINTQQAFMLGLGAQQAGRMLAIALTRIRRMLADRRWAANPLAASVRFWGGYAALPAVWAVNFECMRGCTVDSLLAANIDEVRDGYYRWTAAQFGSDCEDARRTLSSLGVEYYGTLGELAQTVRLLFAEN